MQNLQIRSETGSEIESQKCKSHCSILTDGPEDRVQTMVSQVLERNWENLSYPLSNWQISQLENLDPTGVSCLLKMWFVNENEISEGTHCNATWDNVYCWPPTPVGQAVIRECSEILKGLDEPYADKLEGKALRICLENGTWLWGNWTNYTQCADGYEDYVKKVEDERKLVVTVQHILFIGSLVSIICLAVAVSIFYYFKCLRCDRVTIHIHLMIALMLRSALLIIITEPFLFNRTNHYRNEDIICKLVLSINLYATVASINWMFIQGIYLHGKLTTNVFDKETPFKVYYIVGWIFPLFLIAIYATVMEYSYPVMCWTGYSERPELWILLGPIIFALLANFLFLINIMRILLTKVRWSNSTSDTAQLRRAVKATLVLFPLLGINNLLFLYNPEGEYNKYYVICNSLFGSTQGCFVAILYCFVSRDVRDAIRREYRRFIARHSGNTMRSSRARENENLAQHSTNNLTFRPPQHFRSTMVAATPRNSSSDERSGVRLTRPTSVELILINGVGESESPSRQQTSFLSCFGLKKGDGNRNDPVHDHVDGLHAATQVNREAVSI